MLIHKKRLEDELRDSKCFGVAYSDTAKQCAICSVANKCKAATEEFVATRQVELDEALAAIEAEKAKAAEAEAQKFDTAKTLPVELEAETVHTETEDVPFPDAPELPSLEAELPEPVEPKTTVVAVVEAVTVETDEKPVPAGDQPVVADDVTVKPVRRKKEVKYRDDMPDLPSMPKDEVEALAVKFGWDVTKKETMDARIYNMRMRMFIKQQYVVKE